MSVANTDSNALFVVMSDELENSNGISIPKECHQIYLEDLVDGRQTYISSLIHHSHQLVEEFGLTNLDVIFVSHPNDIQKIDINKISLQLNKSPFVCSSGFSVIGKMGAYYDAGRLIRFSSLLEKSQLTVDIPMMSLCAFRLYKDSSTNFQYYDKWNAYKYLDLELAFHAQERGENFHLVDANCTGSDEVAQTFAKNRTHKAAIYNELFVKNCFDIKHVSQNFLPIKNGSEEQFEQSLEIVSAHLGEIKNSNRKLEYVANKIGNYDALQYNIQENQKQGLLAQASFSFFNSKQQEPVIFSVASIPEREGFLQATIKSIYKQCDQIYVYLNGYEDVPAFLDKPKIKVYRSQEHGDLSANGKVWFLNQVDVNGYVFLIDDDIIYPKDYVQKMVSTLQKYQHKFAACVHGSIFSDQLRWYYQRSAMFPFRRALVHDAIVNLPGSGTFAFHTDTLKVSYDDFAPFTMVDLIMGILCKNQHVPIVCIARPHDWLSVQKDISGRDLWSAFKSVITLHTPTAIANGPWDFNSTKAYVLPKMEAIFGTLNSRRISEYKLDKQFLDSAYKETLPELWSFAGRMQQATEKNYQKFLFSVSNDYLDKTLDLSVYDESSDNLKSYIDKLSGINQRLQQMMAECKLEPKNKTKNVKYLSKIQLEIKQTKTNVALMHKVSNRFMEKKRKLSSLKRQSDW